MATQNLTTVFSLRKFITQLIARILHRTPAPAPVAAPTVPLLPAPAQPIALLPAFTLTRESAALAQAAEAKRRAWRQFCALLELGRELHSESILITPQPGVRVPYPGMPRSNRTGQEIHTATQQAQNDMMSRVPGARNPREAHSVLMAQWIADQQARQAGKARPEDQGAGQRVSIPVKAQTSVPAAAEPTKEHRIAVVNVKREKVIQCIVKGIELDLQRGERRMIIPEEGSVLWLKHGGIAKVRASGEDLEVFNGYDWVRVDEDRIAQLAEIENVPLPPKSEGGH